MVNEKEYAESNGIYKQGFQRYTVNKYAKSPDVPLKKKQLGIPVYRKNSLQYCNTAIQPAKQPAKQPVLVPGIPRKIIQKLL